jgi:hypothetical protein
MASAEGMSQRGAGASPGPQRVIVDAQVQLWRAEADRPLPAGGLQRAHQPEPFTYAKLLPTMDAASAPACSEQGYPFRDMTPLLRGCFDAHRPRRCCWGTDLTNSRPGRAMRSASPISRTSSTFFRRGTTTGFSGGRSLPGSGSAALSPDRGS